MQSFFDGGIILTRRLCFAVGACDALLNVSPGALGLKIAVSLQQDSSGRDLDLDDNEIPVSDVFSIAHGHQELIEAAGVHFGAGRAQRCGGR